MCGSIYFEVFVYLYHMFHFKKIRRKKKC